MSNFEFESNPDGDWDDRGELAWNEHDWQQFLKRNQQEIARFLSHYRNLSKVPNHLDEIAHQMGWDIEEWSALDSNPLDGEGHSVCDNLDRIREDEDIDPYTIHRHPVFIVTHGLFALLQQSWNRALKHRPDAFTASLAWDYAGSLHRGESNAVLSIQALDMGDLALAVCHLKFALSALNDSLRLIQHLPHGTHKFLQSLKNESQVWLFDLREVWLRVMRDCREEIQRRYKDEE
jgi:hypothetical protein